MSGINYEKEDNFILLISSCSWIYWAYLMFYSIIDWFKDWLIDSICQSIFLKLFKCCGRLIEKGVEFNFKKNISDWLHKTVCHWVTISRTSQIVFSGFYFLIPLIQKECRREGLKYCWLGNYKFFLIIWELTPSYLIRTSPCNKVLIYYFNGMFTNIKRTILNLIK